MKDKTNSESWLIWGLASWLCTTSASFVNNLFTNKNLDKDISGNKFQYNSTSNKMSQIKMEVEALSEYNQLGEKINEDLQIIKKTIKDFNSEFKAHIKNNKNLTQEYNTLKNQLKIYSTFQQPEEIITLQRESIRTDEISNILQELVGNYPNNNFNESTTIEEINAAYEELEEHHQKTVDAALTLFPNLYVFLNHVTKGESNITNKETSSLNI